MKFDFEQTVHFYYATTISRHTGSFLQTQINEQ